MKLHKRAIAETVSKAIDDALAEITVEIAAAIIKLENMTKLLEEKDALIKRLETRLATEEVK